jgi:hypothetical protein
MEKTPKEGQVYQHYKHGALYEIILIAEDVDTLDMCVVYKQIPRSEDEEVSPRPWTRSKKKFMEDIEINGQTIPQYVRIS